MQSLTIAKISINKNHNVNFSTIFVTFDANTGSDFKLHDSLDSAQRHVANKALEKALNDHIASRNLLEFFVANTAKLYDLKENDINADGATSFFLEKYDNKFPNSPLRKNLVVMITKHQIDADSNLIKIKPSSNKNDI